MARARTLAHIRTFFGFALALAPRLVNFKPDAAKRKKNTIQSADTRYTIYEWLLLFGLWPIDGGGGGVALRTAYYGEAH